uniref:Uncharacterized protein n=1 Tax=Macaca fascicularis TaxID=9541 RepID=A0A7N9CDA7_MACFA
MVKSQLTATSAPQAQVILCSASQVAGTTGVHHHAQLIFVFSVEMWSHLVTQAGLELLCVSDLPSSASQSAGITGVSHCAQLIFKFFCRDQKGERGGLTVMPRLVLDSWAQVILLLQLPVSHCVWPVLIS